MTRLLFQDPGSGVHSQALMGDTSREPSGHKKDSGIELNSTEVGQRWGNRAVTGPKPAKFALNFDLQGI
ncbi:MAG: hypothetical protein OEN21_19090 [Myxococcales bacterium]|nr:hypothetical protein [Myxococcales bacterium]